MARWSIDVHVRQDETPRPDIPSGFAENTGAFVTIEIYPEETLRGCIGYPEAVLSLEKAIVQAAISACHDPRFPPLAVKELDKVVVEVSLLTPPEPMQATRPMDYVKSIVVGRDGLIVRYAGQSGLLLPQVPVGWNWSEEEFLSQTCMKAGLLPDAWFEPTVQVYRFQAEVFREVEPRGRVIRRELSAVHDGHRG